MEFIRLVNKHPNIKARVASLLLIAEANGDNCEKADDVEAQLVESIRKLGQQVFEGWAISQEQRQASKYTDDHENNGLLIYYISAL